MTQFQDASDIAPGLLVARGVEVPADAEIDPYVTIYSGVRLGRGVRIGQGAVIGRPQRIDGGSRAPRRTGRAETSIGDDCLIGSGTVIVAGARIGARSALSDLVLVRETALIGEDVMIGRGSAVAHTTEIEAGTRIQHEVLIAPRCHIGPDVMIAPRVVFIGDPSMGRNPPEITAPGIRVGRAARIGTAAILCPPLEIGEEALIGAGSFVRDDVAPRTVVVGTPARFLRTVRDDELI